MAYYVWTNCAIVEKRSKAMIHFRGQMARCTQRMPWKKSTDHEFVVIFTDSSYLPHQSEMKPLVTQGFLFEQF